MPTTPIQQTPDDRLHAAWPNGVPPGLQRRIERADEYAHGGIA